MRFYVYLIPEDGPNWGEPVDFDDNLSVAILDCAWPLNPNFKNFKQVGQAVSDGQNWFDAAIDAIRDIHLIRVNDTGRNAIDRESWRKFCIWSDADSEWVAQELIDGVWSETSSE
jgi:hypothetical protein